MCTTKPLRLEGLALVSVLTVLVAAGSWAGESIRDLDPRGPISAPVESEPPMLCFAPGTTPEEIDRAVQRLEALIERNSLMPSTTLKHRIVSSWDRTATDGSGLSQGDPMTLTWSVVPDGTSIPNAIGEGAGASNLRSFLNGHYGNQSTWLALFQQVFDRWGQLTGITYVYEPNDDGSQLFSYSGQLGVRGDIRIGGKTIDGNYRVLAYNYYPDNGDMVIDTSDAFYDNKTSNSRGFRNTVAHEHGHGLGFNHVCPINQTKLMEPLLSWSFDGPQHDDILAANRSYGDRFEHNETPVSAAALGSFGSILEANLSVDNNSDVDVYSFVVDAAGEADVTVTPTGSTYLEGPQNQDGTCTAGSSYNTLTIQDLAVRVLDLDGSTELAAADAAGVGGVEVLDDVFLTSGAGTYYVEVSGDSSNAAQLYSLSLTVSPSDQIFAASFESGDVDGWSGKVP
jgi:hypothetical protein